MMSFHVYWPGLCFMTLFVTCVVIILLRWGPNCCKTRNTALPAQADLAGKSYEQKISMA